MMQSVVWAILVAGGSGKRYSAEKSKLLEHIAGKPVLQRSFEQLCHVPQIFGIVIVFANAWENEYRSCIQSKGCPKQIIWTQGGATRRESVWNGICNLPSGVDIVLVHDAARPLVSPEKIESAIKPVTVGDVLASSLGMPCKNTIKQVVSTENPMVDKTLDRNIIWQVHTPQVFKKEVLIKAHQAVSYNSIINDDAELVERVYPDTPTVLMVLDDPCNLKVTVPEDMELAKALFKKKTILI